MNIDVNLNLDDLANPLAKDVEGDFAKLISLTVEEYNVNLPYLINKVIFQLTQ